MTIKSTITKTRLLATIATLGVAGLVVTTTATAPIVTGPNVTFQNVAASPTVPIAPDLNNLAGGYTMTYNFGAAGGYISKVVTCTQGFEPLHPEPPNLKVGSKWQRFQTEPSRYDLVNGVPLRYTYPGVSVETKLLGHGKLGVYMFVSKNKGPVHLPFKVQCLPKFMDLTNGVPLLDYALNDIVGLKRADTNILAALARLETTVKGAAAEVREATGAMTQLRDQLETQEETIAAQKVAIAELRYTARRSYPSNMITIAAGKKVQTFQACFNDEAAISGAIRLASDDPESWGSLVLQNPQGTGLNSGWSFQAYNAGTKPIQVTTTAICAPRMP